MNPLMIASILLVCCVLLFMLELIVPSGGVISILAIICALAAVVASFFAGTTIGMVFFLSVVCGSALGVFLFFKFWPSTPMGRKIVMRPMSQDEVVDANQRKALVSLIGRQGIAKSVMRPAGSVTIDRQDFDAVSEGMPIDSGDPVEVVAVRMNRLVVSRVEELSAEQDQPSTVDSDDPLAQPIDALGLDPLDDPLA